MKTFNSEYDEDPEITDANNYHGQSSPEDVDAEEQEDGPCECGRQQNVCTFRETGIHNDVK